MKTKNIKRDHHYVWKYYLNAWANNLQICALNKQDKKIISPNTNNVVVCKDFHELNPLTVEDLLHIRAPLINNKNPEIFNSWHDLVEQLFAVQKLQELLNASKKDENFLHSIAYLRYQLIEEIHCTFEKSGIKYIDLFRNNNTVQMNDLQSKYEFLQYLLVQYYRTSKMKKHHQNMLKQITNNRLSDGILHTLENHANLIAISRALNDATFILDTKIIVLTNNTNTKFLTTDQPVIKLKPEENILYYPISPEVSILVTSNKNLDNHELTEKEVKDYNCKLIDSAERFIFAKSKEQLETYIK